MKYVCFRKNKTPRGENLVGGEGLFGWASLVLWPHYYYYHVGGGGRCLIRAFSKKEEEGLLIKCTERHLLENSGQKGGKSKVVCWAHLYLASWSGKGSKYPCRVVLRKSGKKYDISYHDEKYVSYLFQ